MAKQTRQGAPADDDFRAWFGEMIDCLRPKIESIVATGEEHVPVMFVFEKTNSVIGRVGIIPVAMDGLEGKERAFAGLWLAAEQPFVEGVILLTESWMKLANPDKVDRTKSLADDPDRQEAIVLNAMRRNMQLLAYMMIDRTTNTVGDPQVVDPMAPDETMVGRMIYNKPTEH